MNEDTVQMTVTVSGSSVTVTPVCLDAPTSVLTATGDCGIVATTTPMTVELLGTR